MDVVSQIMCVKLSFRKVNLLEREKEPIIIFFSHLDKESPPLLSFTLFIDYSSSKSIKTMPSHASL